MGRYDKNVLVVSGTANSGEAIVEAVASAGGSTVFTYNSKEERAQGLLNRIPDGEHTAVKCDVTDPKTVESTVSTAKRTLGTIDALVYTVGVIDRDPVAGGDYANWNAHLDANVTGAFNVISEIAPVFESQGHGTIVGLSASEGILRSDQLSAYDASKQGLVALIKETARELGPAGIRANVVAPGYIRDPETLTDEHREELLHKQPFKQVTAPADIAEACLFLCSDDAATITGAVLPVDSGLAL